MCARGLNDMDEKKGVDFYRDTPVRYLGYANEVGEAFRVLVPRSVVYGSYAVSFSYVFADAVSKYSSSSTAKHANAISPIAAFVDALTWQSLASVIIPGFTINRICNSCMLGLNKALPRLPVYTKKWACTAIGLFAIPFIIRPIDRTVDYAMDKTLRQLYTKPNSNE